MPMMDVPPALAAGAAVLTKPSEVAPMAWSECVRGWREEIGAPPVLACATGLGATGAAVVDNVDMLMFTGSTATGRKIASAAAERLIPFSLELGGKDAMIVLEDANLDRAVGAAIWGGLFNAGQSCLAVERCYVHEAVYESFVAKLVAEVDKLRVGMDPLGSLQSDLGALATDAQMAIVERHVNDAIGKGARVLTGGVRRDHGLFYPPTVLVNVNHTMTCMQEETFGPTIPIMKIHDEDEAVRLANDSPYGLGGSIWTADETRAERIARHLEAGAVNANNVMVSPALFGLPFGGWKNSGLGSRFGGAEGLLKYCRRQGFVSERFNLDSELHWYPHTKRRAMITNAMVRLLGAPGWRRKLGRRGSGGLNAQRPRADGDGARDLNAAR
jgi:acyl-CoA reductase-like NAD-dependent aldehyde dehydrogenase